MSILEGRKNLNIEEKSLTKPFFSIKSTGIIPFKFFKY